MVSKDKPGVPRLTEPRYSTRDRRVWITYPDLDLPGLLHGIVVFKELRPGLPHEQWTQAVRAHLMHDSPIAGMPLVIPHQVHGAKIATISDGGPLSRGGNLVRSESSKPGESLSPEAACMRGDRSGYSESFLAQELPCVETGERRDETLSIDPPPERDPMVDGLVTDLSGIAIAVSVADCLPLLAFNPESSVVGVAHCGWRSIAGGIVEEFVRSLEGVSRDAGNTRFVIGAGIGECCYQVRDDLLSEFTPDEVRRFSVVGAGAAKFDLKGTVAARLACCGIAPTDISIDKTCTSCKKDLLSSYRADRPDCGRMVAFMALAGRE